MKRRRPLLRLALVLGCAAPLGATLDDTLDELREKPLFATAKAPAKPAVDFKGKANQSNSFLKDREPEMTTEEYAIYEKVMTMLSTSPDLAIRLLESMMTEKEKPSPAFEFILGNAYASANQTDRAEASYRSAAERFPTFLRAWSNLALLYYTTGRFADAAACFSKVVALGDRESATLGLLGYCLEQMGEPVSAEAAYLSALGAEPANPDWKEGLFRLAINGRQYGRAEQLGRNLIKDKPAEVRLWLNYAGALVAGGHKFEAMAVLEQAQASVALDSDSLIMLGDLYAELGLAAEAAGLYQKVLGTARPRGEQKLLQFANVLIASGNLPDAEHVLNALPGDLPPAARQAQLLARANLGMARQRWPEARRDLEALLALAPLHGRALLALGRTYLEENNLPRATLAFEAAVQVPDTAYQANLELANVELKNRHFAKAVGHLEKALQLQRTDAIEDYLARLRTLVPAEGRTD